MEIREAGMDDARMLYEWRNDPVTRAHSFQPAPLAWEAHLSWLERTLQREEINIYLVFENGVPVGTFRLDRIDREQAEISITIGPPMRGKGYAKKVLNAASLIAKNDLGYSSILAKIKHGNTASQKAFLRAGYESYAVTMRINL